MATEMEKHQQEAMVDHEERDLIAQLINPPTGSMLRSLRAAVVAAAQTVGTNLLSIQGHRGVYHFHGGDLGAGPTRSINVVEAAILLLEHLADPPPPDESGGKNAIETTDDLMRLFEL